MLVVSGEMGRTPRINELGGRDHWGGLAPLLISGGGFRLGRCWGSPDRQAAEPLTTPIRIPNLVSTIMHRLIDVPQLRLVPECRESCFRRLWMQSRLKSSCSASVSSHLPLRRSKSSAGTVSSIIPSDGTWSRLARSSSSSTRK